MENAVSYVRVSSDDQAKHGFSIGQQITNNMDCALKNGYNIGGEQSGHIILGDYSTTGDGVLVALQVLSILAYEKKKISGVILVYMPKST